MDHKLKGRIKEKGNQPDQFTFFDTPKPPNQYF